MNIIKNPLSAVKITTPPLPPNTGMRGLFPAEDGWYDINDDGVVCKIASADDINDLTTAVTTTKLDVPASGYVTYNTTFDYDELISLKVSAESNIYVTVGKKGSGMTDWMLWGASTLIAEIDIVPECKNQIDIGDPTVADGDEITVYIYSRDGVSTTATIEETRVNKLTDRVAALEATVGNISAVLDAINGEVV